MCGLINCKEVYNAVLELFQFSGSVHSTQQAAPSAKLSCSVSSMQKLMQEVSLLAKDRTIFLFACMLVIYTFVCLVQYVMYNIQYAYVSFALRHYLNLDRSS